MYHSYNTLIRLLMNIYAIDISYMLFTCIQQSVFEHFENNLWVGLYRCTEYMLMGDRYIYSELQIKEIFLV